ncbi:MAG: RIO1 family regulatory kinase/ATPase [Candidatus Limnocylindria bacterium]
MSFAIGPGTAQGPASIKRPPLFEPDWLVDGEYHEEPLGILKTGKESEVSLVARVGADGRTSYLAEKRFKSRMFRSFQDDTHYREDWFRGPGGARARRGIKRGREIGHRLLEGAWVWHEWSELNHLYEAGVTVPPPAGQVTPTARAARDTRVPEAEGGYRMAFIGDAPVAAPRLASLRLERDEAEHLWHAVLDEVALMLLARRAHGDLSAYNVLYWRERPVIIDLSQTVDLATHAGARALVRRDLERLATYFERQGARVDPDAAWRETGAERALEGRP